MYGLVAFKNAIYIYSKSEQLKLMSSCVNV